MKWQYQTKLVEHAAEIMTAWEHLHDDLTHSFEHRVIVDGS